MGKALNTQTYDKREESRKYVLDGLVSFNQDSKCSSKDIKEIKCGIEKVFEHQRQKINERYGQRGVAIIVLSFTAKRVVI